MFVKEKFIRFQHCDPAGIVFYPHYFVLFHELVEDWFNEGIGESYAHFVKHHGMGLPMAKVECEFLAPNSIGDTLSLDLRVKRIGNSSIHPRAIVALGKFAAQTLLRDNTGISRMRGNWREYDGIKLMPTFHPSYLLREPGAKRQAWDDLRAVMERFMEQ